jgi:acyl carrier protein
MSANDKMNNIIFEQVSFNEDKVLPDASFLDDLSADSLGIVELIMAAGTGQKDVIHQLRLTASTYRRF